MARALARLVEEAARTRGRSVRLLVQWEGPIDREQAASLPLFHRSLPRGAGERRDGVVPRGARCC